MIRLYNKHLAMTPAGVSIAEGAHRAIQSLVEDCIALTFDLRDAQNIVTSEVTCVFAEAILNRAVRMRQKQQPAAPNTAMNRLLSAIRKLEAIVRADYDLDSKPEDLPSWKEALDEAEAVLKEFPR
jgi:hypothetical protein